MEYVIRGRGSKWRVWYPDESNLPTPVPVIRDGVVVNHISAGAPNGKLVESQFVGTAEECETYIRALHPDATIKRERIATRTEALKKAHAARRRSAA